MPVGLDSNREETVPRHSTGDLLEGIVKRTDFNEEFNRLFWNICPAAISKLPKVRGCLKSTEVGHYPKEDKCRQCWWEYINQGEQQEMDQQELFGGDE